jgi:demethylmenaquinone methyltransferase / 2-methoxy-6-polyprenyl-1,4-benzoquinol methylase
MSEAVKALFANIAPKYDLLNRVLSARNDVRWRRRILREVAGAPTDVLDLACGTFDLGLEALAQGKAKHVHGCDFCQPMLVAGTDKRKGHPLSASVGDALRLPFADGSFDLAMVAYGWRNFGDPGGQLLILEFFRPTSWWPKTFYGSFGKLVFPLVGGTLTGNADAYRYLNDSIARFLSREEADAAIAEAGFTSQRWVSFFGGVSHGVVAGRSS